MRRSETKSVDFYCFGSFMVFLADFEVRFVKISTIKPPKFDFEPILTTFLKFSKIRFLTPGSLSGTQKIRVPNKFDLDFLIKFFSFGCFNTLLSKSELGFVSSDLDLPVL